MASVISEVSVPGLLAVARVISMLLFLLPEKRRLSSD